MSGSVRTVSLLGLFREMSAEFAPVVCRFSEGCVLVDVVELGVGSGRAMGDFEADGKAETFIGLDGLFNDVLAEGSVGKGGVECQSLAYFAMVLFLAVW